jgi:hypothetical protein
VEELPAGQREVVRTIGNAIISSFQPNCRPVQSVRVQGHADYDTPRNSEREQQISEERARQVTSWLRSYVTNLLGSEKANQINWAYPIGLGATRLKAPPTTESNRSQNRRVEVFVTISPPAPPPPPPQSPSFDEECLAKIDQDMRSCLDINRDPDACANLIRPDLRRRACQKR